MSFMVAGAYPGFGQGGTQLLRLKVANIAEQSHMSKASYLCGGVHVLLKGPGIF